MKKEYIELNELKHDPEPGFKTAFYIVTALAFVYLAVIFVRG